MPVIPPRPHGSRVRVASAMPKATHGSGRPGDRDRPEHPGLARVLEEDEEQPEADPGRGAVAERPQPSRGHQPDPAAPPVAVIGRLRADQDDGHQADQAAGDHGGGRPFAADDRHAHRQHRRGQRRDRRHDADRGGGEARVERHQADRAADPRGRRPADGAPVPHRGRRAEPAMPQEPANGRHLAQQRDQQHDDRARRDGQRQHREHAGPPGRHPAEKIGGPVEHGGGQCQDRHHGRSPGKV